MTAPVTTSPAASRSIGIAATFERARSEGRTALLPFITVGFPDLATSEEIAMALVEAGADAMEIGVPFSDPLADGSTVQRTGQVALAQGTRLVDCLELVRRLRSRGVTIPLVLMGYTNPFYQYGYDRLAADAAEIGVDGFIVPDLPAEESDRFLEACRAHGRDLIFLVAPTSTDERLRLIAERASGFVYCVSLTGVTGARSDMAAGLPEYIARVRATTDLPLVVGFGISTAEHVATVGKHADGAIIASAMINAIEVLPPAEQPAAAAAFMRGLS